MAKNDNPFAIRKSPVSIISAQALNLDDYVQRTLDENSISEEGIAKINATSKLVLRRRGDSAVEFYNAANRFYVVSIQPLFRWSRI